MNEIQEQYHEMLNFIEDTPTIDYHNGDWWVGPFPYYYHVDKYSPEAIARAGEKPIILHWYEYLFEMESFSEQLRKQFREVIEDHLRKSKELEIDALLEASRENASGQYLEMIELFESQYKYLIEKGD